MKFARATGIDKFKFDVFADALEVAIAPFFPRIGGGCAAAFVHWAIVNAASGVRLDFIGRTPEDIDVAAIGAPAGGAGSEMLVGVGDAAVVLFLGRVFGRIGFGIADVPEMLDELVALFVGGETKEGGFFFGRDDVGDVFVEPRIEGIAEFAVELLFALFAIFGAERLRRGV